MARSHMVSSAHLHGTHNAGTLNALVAAGLLADRASSGDLGGAPGREVGKPREIGRQHWAPPSAKYILFSSMAVLDVS
jgi:hypothetical protein